MFLELSERELIDLIVSTDLRAQIMHKLADDALAVNNEKDRKFYREAGSRYGELVRKMKALKG